MTDIAPLLLQPGQVILNKYEVLGPLGCGQFGQVFQVLNRNLGKVSALKIILVDDPASHRAVVEAQAQSLCGHDHVVEIRTADVFERSVLIEMEYIEGGSLANRMTREFVPLVDSIAYVKQILFALEHAHARGIVHRDVKPGNIMLAPNRAKLSDFGTAIHPATGIRVSDAFYVPHAPPEAMNNGQFSPASDVFAAGLTLLRAANNMPGWGHVLDDAGTWQRDVLNGMLPAKVGYEDWVPRALKTILNRACAKNPAERYPSSVAFRQALERLKPGRRWVRVSPDLWTCEHEGRAEALRYEPGRKHAVDYVSGGRRRRNYCRSFETEREAQRWLGRVVADTSLGTGGAKATRKRKHAAAELAAAVEAV